MTLLPDVVEKYMGKINAKLGTDYQLFNYYGAPDADRVIIAMGSICDVAEEVIDYLNAHGEKVGLVKVRLYRPFRADKLLWPPSPPPARRSRFWTAPRSPALRASPSIWTLSRRWPTPARFNDVQVIGGRYGLGSKDTPPASVFAVYDELKKDAPKRQFTIGIVDDVTHLSLEEKPAPNVAPEGTIACKFWGLGGDGTVGANKNSTKIIGDHTDKYIQAYFQYDSKKTGGVTISHLRFGDKPIKSSYYINKADFVACHVPAYITKHFPIVRDVKPGGVFLINCQWNDEELAHHLDAASKRYIAQNNIQVYTINAIDLAKEIGMGKRTNTILQSAFFSLAKVLPRGRGHPVHEGCRHPLLPEEGSGRGGYEPQGHRRRALPPTRSSPCPLTGRTRKDADGEGDADRRPTLWSSRSRTSCSPSARMDGDSLPVSAFLPTMWTASLSRVPPPTKSAAWRSPFPPGIAAKCIQCNNCAYVCPHATIRPYALTEEEAAKAPAAAKIVDIKAGKGKGVYKYTMAVSPLDCMGCGVCVGVCPDGRADHGVVRSRKPRSRMCSTTVWMRFPSRPTCRTTPSRAASSSSPMLEFSGSCAGCAETSYARLVTQLFGDRMYISNATGCSSIWGGPAATSPYCTDKNGHGPAWANSLFEDNAEHGLGHVSGSGGHPQPSGRPYPQAHCR